MKKKFYFPLTVNVCKDIGWGIDWDYVDKQDGRLAIAYQYELEIAFREYDDGEDMVEYIWDDESFKKKVTSMIWGFEVKNDCLYGIVEVQLTQSLNEVELKDIKRFISGQNSDGLGEGFEQRVIRIADGEMSVSFWHSGEDYYIYTEEEFETFIINAE